MSKPITAYNTTKSGAQKPQDITATETSGNKYSLDTFINNSTASPIPVNVVSGGTGGSTGRYTQYMAGETMSALKFVYVGPDGKIYLGDSGFALKSEIVGMTVSAGAVDTLINVVSFGPAFDVTFTYGYSNSLYLTTNGNVSTTSPIVGYRALVGKGLNDGQIFVDIDEVITL